MQTLINPQTGHLAFKLYHFEGNNPFDHIQRLNYYSLIWIKKGTGKIKVDFSEYDFGPNALLAFSPYQPFMICGDDNIVAEVIHFHPDFFCIHKHQHEVACNGVLFNNIYDSPIVQIDPNSESVLNGIIPQMKSEIQAAELAHYEVLISYLKIFLVTASRLKNQQAEPKLKVGNMGEEPQMVQRLKDAINEHFCNKHSARDYAELLAISPKALNKITKDHFNKTLTNLIAERIIIEAKRELYLSHKTIKEIAYRLGYEDEYYFSRFFKKHADVSPQLYRETIGFNKASTV